MQSDNSRIIRLNMLAVQIAGEFPGDRTDARYVLRRIEKILDDCVFDKPADAPGRCSDVVRLSDVRGDRAV